MGKSGGITGERRNNMVKTEEQIRKEMLKIQAIMEEVAHDPEVRQAMEEAQRELGTLTPEELRRQCRNG